MGGRRKRRKKRRVNESVFMLISQLWKLPCIMLAYYLATSQRSRVPCSKAEEAC